VHGTLPCREVKGQRGRNHDVKPAVFDWFKVDLGCKRKCMNVVVRQLVFLAAGALLLPWSLAISFAQSAAVSGADLDGLRARAERGEVEAQLRMGGLCEKSGDLDGAVKWMRRAADKGLPQAQHNLGVYYSRGMGVPKDAAEAVTWWRRAAESGLPSSQFNLGVKYENGDGVPKDAAEAVKWYRKAAEQGNALAQFNLGTMYANGDGVPKNVGEAVKWYRKGLSKATETPSSIWA
jgi:TPR repeat protein